MQGQNIESVQELFIRYLEEQSSYKDLLERINFKFKYNDPRLQGEITPAYIEMLSKYQESIYFAYLVSQGKGEDLKNLKDEEKQALSLKFKVKDGSDIFHSMIENLDNFVKLADGKMTGEQIIIFAGIAAGYLTLSKVIELINNMQKRKIAYTLHKDNIDREKELYKTFSEMASTMQHKKFNDIKLKALHQPLYEYDGNVLITAEETITSKEAERMRVQPKITTQYYKGLYFLDGLRGAGENTSHTTYWLIDEKNDHTFSIQLGKNELDTLRKGLLNENIGKNIYLDLEIKRKDGLISSKKINTLYTRDTNPELFL